MILALLRKFVRRNNTYVPYKREFQFGFAVRTEKLAFKENAREIQISFPLYALKNNVATF